MMVSKFIVIVFFLVPIELVMCISTFSWLFRWKIKIQNRRGKGLYYSLYLPLFMGPVGGGVLVIFTLLPSWVASEFMTNETLKPLLLYFGVVGLSVILVSYYILRHLIVRSFNTKK